MIRSGSRLAVRALLCVARDLLRLALLPLRSRAQLAAENLFLRKQLALYVERQVKPRRADDATRFVLVTLSRLVDWQRLLLVREARHLDSMASEGVPAVLALEIEVSRAPASPRGATTADSRDGRCEPDLARGADSRRTLAEAGDSGLAAHRE